MFFLFFAMNIGGQSVHLVMYWTP